MLVILGTDPEAFVRIGRDYISAHNIFPGTKKDPYKIDKGAVQVDGTAVEFNIDPASNEDQFVNNIQTVKVQLSEMLHKFNPEAIIDFVPIVKYRDDIWESIPNDCKILGCDPDWNYSGEVNQNPIEVLGNTSIRTAAGHIHIGFRNPDQYISENKKFKDALYVARKFHQSGIFEPKTSGEQERLKYYGHNGSFRPKSYGVELRSPSNLWLREEGSIRSMYRGVRETYKAAVGF
jgi:hypothetical protein